MRTTSAIILIILFFVGFQFIPLDIVAVTGDSMHPTIPDGSLQLVHETNNAQKGDIIVFQSQQAEDRMIIHRIQSAQPDGFVTIGDNNEMTDQAVGEPLVRPEYISGNAITVGEQPIFIPYLGSLFQFITNYTIEAIMISLGGLGVYAFYKEIILAKKQLGMLTVNDIIFPIFVTVFLGLALVILIGSTTLSATIVYTTSDVVAEQQYRVPVGQENPTETLTFKTAEKLGTETYVSSYNIIEVDSTGEEKRLLVELPERDSPGVESGYVKIYRYPPIMPQSWLQSATNITPLLPAVTSSAVLLIPLYLLFYIFGEPHQKVSEPRNRWFKKIYSRWFE